MRWKQFSVQFKSVVTIFRVTTCLKNLENLEMSGNYTDVKNFTKSQGKNLVMENFA